MEPIQTTELQVPVQLLTGLWSRDTSEDSKWYQIDPKLLRVSLILNQFGIIYNILKWL